MSANDSYQIKTAHRRFWRGRIATLALALVIITTLMVAATTKPAYAAFSDCSSTEGWVCIWQDINYSGNIMRIWQPTPNSCYTFPSVWWDKMSSFYNFTGHSLTFYSWQNCGLSNHMLDVGPYEADPTMLWVNNDNMRSFWFY